MVIIVSIQSAKGASMVCSQRHFFTICTVVSSTTGMFSFVSKASKCAWIIGISGQFLVGWPCCSQMAQGEICLGSAVAFAFFPLALFEWGSVGVGVVVGFFGPGGG